MDDTEAWLKANDPGYATKTWNDDGVFELDDIDFADHPAQEVPYGGPVQLQSLVDGGDGRLARVTLDRACSGCYGLFTPLKPWARFCSDRCRWRSQKRQQRRVKP